jgi:L-ribulose-5-phosphate 3-epimerase
LEEQRNRFLTNIRPLADEAAAAGITICLETHGGLLATGVIAKKLIQDIGKSNIGINYDPGNVIFYGGVLPEEDIQQSADAVRHVHCKDQIGGPGIWNFPTVGTGEVKFAEIFAALDKVGFNGPVSVEIEFQGEPWPSLEDVNKAVADSYAFVRSFVKS